MRKLCEVRGYAAIFDEWSSPLNDGGEPFIEIIRPGSFRFLNRVIPATVLHDPGVQVATTWNKTLRVWPDRRGLAIELDVPLTPDGLALRNMVASGGFSSMSVGLITLAATDFRDEDGALRREVLSADVDHVALVDRGAYEGTACWLSDMPPDCMPPRIGAASRHWHLGRIAHEKMQAADREMVARFFAKSDADKKRANRRPELLQIPPIPQAMKTAMELGLY